MPHTDADIDAIVATILENDAVNIDFIPDALEARVYRNVVRLVLGLLEESLDNVDISLFGRKLTIKLE